MEKKVQINDNRITIRHGALLNDIYAFVHDMQEPHCNHFKEEELQVIFESESILVFRQDYHYLGNRVSLKHHIDVSFDVSWKIIQLNSFGNIPCRFGLSFPIPGKVLIEDGIEAQPLINYEQYWRYNWSGQSNLDLPIIKLPFHPSYFMSLPLEENVQFYCYQDNNKSRLKIATMYEEDYVLNIKMSLAINPDYRHEYSLLYPESSSYVYQWRTLFEKIKNKYGIAVTHKILQKINIESTLLSEEELSSVAEILDNELEFYPRSIWRTGKLKKITVCGNMRSHNDSTIHGMNWGNDIVINGSDNPIDIKKSIHHELFHIFEKTSSSEIRLWDELPCTDMFYEHCKVVRSQVTPQEYRAELFAQYIVTPAFVQNILNQDKVVRSKWKLVLAILDEDCRKAVMNHKPGAENTDIVLTSSKNLPENNLGSEIVFVAAKNVDPNLLQSIIEENLRWVTIDQAPPKTNVVCLTMNPLDYCAIEYSANIPSVTAMDEWLSFHKNAIKINARFLHVEKIYQSQWAMIKRFFAGTNLKIQEITPRGRSDQLRRIPLKGIPMLENVWKSVRSHSITEQVGYHQISFRE